MPCLKQDRYHGSDIEPEPELWGAKNIRQVVEKRRAHQNPLFAESTEWLDFTKRRSSPMDPTNPGGNNEK